MGKIALFFDTESGSTNRVATLIRRSFDDGVVDIFSAAQMSEAVVDEYGSFILGTPSLDKGRLPDSWQLLLQSDGFDFGDKTVALFGLGDQKGYPSQFVDGLGILYDHLARRGAKIVGFWPVAGYQYTRSGAERDGQFVGLVVDQDNQPELTVERVARWAQLISAPLLQAAR